MVLRSTVNRIRDAALSTGVWLAMAGSALAGGGGGALPWDTTLTTIQNDATGTIATTLTTASVVGAGLMWGIAEHGSGVRKFSSLAFGGAAALGAAQVVTGLFGGGALI